MKNTYKKYQQQASLLLVKGKFVSMKKLKQYLGWEHSWKTTSVGLMVLFVALFLGISIIRSSAASVVLVPDGDVTTGWTTLGGTNDATCSAGTHCDYVDENTVDKTTDYVGTGTSLGNGVTEEYDMTTQTGIASATQIALRVYAQSATNANGSSLDTISINVRINGTLQTATNCTPAFNTWAACSATYNGSWTQSDIDSLRVQIVRNVVGSGSPSNQDDDVRIANVYTTLTYTANINYNQSAYRWFNNTDSASPATFVNQWGAAGQDSPISYAKTNDGGYVATGNTSFGAGSNDMFLVKYNSQGLLTWVKSWGGTSTDTGYSVAQTSDGGYVVTGETYSFGAGSNDMFIAKYDSSGTLSWSRTWGGASADVGQTVVQASDGGYVVMGNTSNYGAGGTDTFLAKYDSSGTLSWSRTWGGAGTDTGLSLIKTSDDGYAVTGGTSTYGSGSTDVFLAKYDSSGTLSWSRTWGGATIDTGKSIVQSSDGGYIIGGQTDGFGAGGYDMVILKYDSSGTLSWSRTLGGSGTDTGESITQAADGGYAIVGGTSSFGAGSNDVFLAKYDSSGTLSWSRTWGDTTYDVGKSILANSDGGFTVGSTYGANSNDLLISKYDSNGNISGCSSPMCQTPSSTGGTPSGATVTTPSPSTSTPSPTTGTPSPVSGTPTGTEAAVVALSPTTIDVGTAMAAQDTVATAPSEGTPFRLRVNIHISGSQLDASAGQLKLQFALKGAAASCSAIPGGSSWVDVTDSSTVQYYNNTKAVGGLGLATNANDPTHSTDTLVRQSYLESGTSVFGNASAIPAGQDGMWDFALVGYRTIQNDRYCFKITQSNGADLNTYTQYPELIIPPATFNQAAYRWYNNGTAGTNLTFAESYDVSSGSISTYGAVATSTGGYAVTGDTFVGGSQDAFIASYDSRGALLWANNWGAQGGGSSATSIVETSDGGFAITGQSYAFSANAAFTNIFVVKFDVDGNEEFSTVWQSSASDYAYGIVQTSDGGYAVTGLTNGYGSGGVDAVLIKFTSSGAVSWTKTWGGSADDSGQKVVQTSDGGYAVTGATKSYTSGNDDIFLAKFTSTGTLSWSRTWGGISNDQGNDIVQTSDGGYAIAGTTDSFGGTTRDAVILKYDNTGTLSWNQTWGGTTNQPDLGKGIVQTSDGGYALSGSTSSYGAGSTDTFLAKYDNTGVLSWSTTWGTTNSEYNQSLSKTADGGYALTANSSSENMLLRYDSSGNIANCTAPMCQTPTAKTTTPSVTPGSPTAGVTSPTVTAFSSTDYNVPLSLTVTVLVGPAVPIGSPLAPVNTPLDLTVLTPMSLRIAIAVNDSGIGQTGQSFKLQYALNSGASSCSGVSSGSYSDVTSSTPLAFYDDASYASGNQIDGGANDPTDGVRTMILQSYQESNNFTNNSVNLYAGQDGIWQFSLIINNTTLKGKNFCLRAATSGGTQLTASNIADMAYAPLMTQMMKNGKWFNRQGIEQPYSL